MKSSDIHHSLKPFYVDIDDHMKNSNHVFLRTGPVQPIFGINICIILFFWVYSTWKLLFISTSKRCMICFAYGCELLGIYSYSSLYITDMVHTWPSPILPIALKTNLSPIIICTLINIIIRQKVSRFWLTTFIDFSFK